MHTFCKLLKTDNKNVKDELYSSVPHIRNINLRNTDLDSEIYALFYKKLMKV